MITGIDAPLTFRELCDLSPEFAELNAEARAAREPRWSGHDAERVYNSGFRGRVAALIGAESQQDDPRLRTCWAYDTAVDAIRSALDGQPRLFR